MKTYHFFDHATCEMCGLSEEVFKILGRRLNSSQGRKPHRVSGISTTIKKCTNCGLVFSDPMPIPQNILDHYGTSPESYWKEEYFKIDPTYFTKQIAEFKSLVPDGKTALDIGAGIGKGMIAMENAGIKTWGIEPSEPFFKMALDKLHIDPSRLQCSPLEKIDFPKEKFDFITFGAVLEHLYYPGQMIEKVLHWLKPNGVIHAEIPSSTYFMTRLHNWFYKISASDYVANLSPMHVPYHLYEFSLESFEKLGVRLNFEIANYQSYVGPIYGGVPKIFQKPLKRYMKNNNSGMQLEVWLRKPIH